MKHYIAIAAAALCVIGGASAQAGSPQDDGPSVSVSYADLDLSTPAGRAALDGRIHAAIDRVCPAQDARELERRQYELACRATAKASAVRQVASIYSHRDPARTMVQVAPTQR